MKKIMIIAAAVAALAACSKEAETVVDSNHFEKGQKVTLTVKAGEPSTRVSSELNADGETVDFKWQANDKIKVTVNGQSEEFTLIGDGGSNEGKFEGEMPDGGSTFSVQYPYDDPEIADQTYPGSEALPHDKMLFKDENCQLSEMTFELQAQYAALRLNLWGTSQTISKIVVTNTTSSETPKPTYTLTMDPAVTLPTAEANAQAFFIVVPEGSWGFTAEVYDNAETPAKICEFSPTAAQAFENGEFLNMPAKEVKKAGNFYPGTELEGIKIGDVVWAPVNCGYEPATTGYAGYPYGKLYQWGRKYGQGYTGDATTPTIADYWTGTNGNEDSNTFYKYCSSGATYSKDWIKSGDNAYWNTGTESAPTKTKYDPCPTGWRVPTYAELNALTGNNGDTSIGGNGWDSTNKGYWFNGTTSPVKGNGLFLPAAGCRSRTNGDAYYRWSDGYYWSSSVDGSYGRRLYFLSGDAGMDTGSRAFGYSVRCVQE